MLASGHSGVPQDEDRASQAPRFGADYQSIDWSHSATSIHTQVRGLEFSSLPPGLAKVRRLTSTAGGGASLGRA